MKTWIYSIVIVVVVLVAGSMLSSIIMNNHHGGHHGVFEKIEHTAFNDSADVSSVRHLASLDTVSVNVDGRHFAIPERIGEITSYKCSECHNEPLDDLKAIQPKIGEKSHWNIQLKHASDEVMNCFGCHGNGNMDELHSITNQKISFNESYKLCAQCHQMEYKDWVGGAHGKRIGGWAKPVVKNTCVNCHNPHEPGFPHKQPSRINTRMIEQRAKK